MREACRFIEESLAIPVASLPEDALVNCAKTAMSSKIIGSDGDVFARLAVDAMQAVRVEGERGEGPK